MQPLSLANLAANAYRTLGLSGAADQSGIASAARRLRIWADPGDIPVTAWDFPMLGPIDRSRVAIEQAVARLESPDSRVAERVIWYTGAHPPKVGTSYEATSDPTYPAAHDALISALHAAWLFDPIVSHPQRWRGIWDGVLALADSMDFIDWQIRLEDEGNFEKRASIEEIGDALNRLAPALEQALVPKAKAALDRGDQAAGVALLSMFRGKRSASEKLLDELEDELGIHCRRVDTELRKELQTDDNAPDQYYIGNRYHTFFAAEHYMNVIFPKLTNLRNLLDGNDIHRRDRVDSMCSSLLKLIALGHEWSGEWIKAEECLVAAYELAISASAQEAIQQDRARIRPSVDHWRKVLGRWKR